MPPSALFRWRLNRQRTAQSKRPRMAREDCSPRVATRRYDGEMRGLAVIFRCIWLTALEKSRYGRPKARAASVFGPDYPICRACHRLERMAFCLFGKQNKSDSPRSCTGGKRYRDAKATIFCRSDRWEGTKGLKKNRARRRDIPPPRFAQLTPEQARAVSVANALQDGPVVKQLLEWIAELENRRPHKK